MSATTSLPGGPRTGVWTFPDGDAFALVELAEQIEGLGFDEWWLGDEGPAREPFSVLSAAAMRTSRIRLGIGISNPFTRHPALTTTTAHTLHELSGGRAILGVGAGGELALGPFQLRVTKPVSAVDRFIRIARAVATRSATEGYVPADGAVGNREDLPALPLYVGARGEMLNRLASRVADGAFVSGIAPLFYEDTLRWIRHEHPIDVALYSSVAFTEQEIEKLRPQMIWALHNSPEATRRRLDVDDGELEQAVATMRNGDDTLARAFVTDSLLREVLVVGSPEEVGLRLGEFVRMHRPTSIGLALATADVRGATVRAAAAMAVMRASLLERDERPDYPPQVNGDVHDRTETR